MATASAAGRRGGRRVDDGVVDDEVGGLGHAWRLGRQAAAPDETIASATSSRIGGPV